MFYGGSCHGFGGGWFSMIFWIALIGAGAYFLTRHRSGGCRSGVDMNSNQDVLNRRLAKGEISEEEYDRLSEKLRR